MDPNLEWKFLSIDPNYMISENGDIWSNHSNKILKQSKDVDWNYSKIKIGNKCYKTHRLVYESFYNHTLQPKEYIDHIDQKCENNHYTNLRIVTGSENNRNRRKYHVKRKVVYNHDSGFVDIGIFDGIDLSYLEVNSKGVIRRKDNHRVRAQSGTKYPYIAINTKERNFHARVHKIVAHSYHGKIPEDYVVDHLDSDPSNPESTNLEYTTQKENVIRAKGTPVYRINKETNEIIDSFPSISLAGEQIEKELGYYPGRKINRTHISAVCKGKRISAFNYIWKFKEVEKLPEKVQIVKELTEDEILIEKIKENGGKVDRYNKFTEEYIDSFDNVDIAAEALTEETGGKFRGCYIKRNCKGENKSAYGYIWKFNLD